MAKRGKPSAASLAVVTRMEDSRPFPPDDLTEDQREIWITTVGRLPQGWFPPETWEVLAGYTRHVTTARMLSTEIARWRAKWFDEDGGVERFDRLCKMRDRETRGMLACARSLRLTNQSRRDPKAAGRAARDSPLEGHRPWDPQ